MRTTSLHGTAAAALLFLSVLVLVSVPVSVSHAQSGDADVYWHIDPGVETCSMVIDPTLTQDQWHTFTRQVSAIASFKSLSAAETLGKGKFAIVINNAVTPVDQRDPAWINTFTHPDEFCPLGDRISFPTLRAKMGVADNMDVGVFWTTAPDANYGAAGVEYKYAFLPETGQRPAAALRASYSMLTGVPDFNLNLYSLDLMTSKKVAMFTPYAGVRESWVFGRETTEKVDLQEENLAVTQGYVGMAYTIWKLNLAAEYNVATVNTFVYAVGFTF